MSDQQFVHRLPADTLVLDVSIDPDATPPVVPELLAVEAEAMIRFRLTSAASRRYEFAVDQPPIVVHDGGANFGKAHRLSDSLVTLRDRHASDGEFAYSIHVVERKSRRPVCIDPVIRNEQ